MQKHCFCNSRNAKTLFLALPSRQNTVFATPVTPKHCFCNSRNTKTLFMALPSTQNTYFATPVTPKHLTWSQLVTPGNTWSPPGHHLTTTGNTRQHLATTSGRYTDLKHRLYSGAALPNLNFPPFFRPCVGRLGPFQKYA